MAARGSSKGKGKEEIKKEPVVKEKFTSAGTLPLDLQLGGGMPWGRIVNLVGDNSTGKTLMALEIIYRAIRTLGDKVKWRYDDAEAGFGFDSEVLYGFKAIDEEFEHSTTISQFEYNFRVELDKLKEDEYLIYVVDSLDGLSSDEEIERADEKYKLAKEGKKLNRGTYNLTKQRDLTSFFRTRAGEIENKRCLLLVISQVRANLEMFGKKFTRSGGKGLDHWANQVIWLYKCDKIEKTVKGKKYLLGVSIRAEIDKNKSGKPHRESTFDIIFDYGVDDIGACVDYLYDLRTDTGKLKKNTVVTFNAKEFSRDDLIEAVSNDEKLYEHLRESVKEKFNEIESQLKPSRSKI